jgi:hypothetical protein
VRTEGSGRVGEPAEAVVPHRLVEVPCVGAGQDAVLDEALDDDAGEGIGR